MSIGDSRVLGAQMEVAAAYEAIRRAQKEAERERRPVPAVVADKLRNERDLAMANLSAAHAAVEAAKRFPPLRFT